MRSLGLLVLLSTLGLQVSAARADDGTRASADALFEQGKSYYQTNQFRLAIEKFLQAYELVRDPVYLFNIAQSYRNAADCEKAFEFYTRYLTEDKAAANADSVRGWIAELRPCAERVRQLSERAEAASKPAKPSPSTPAPAPAESAPASTGTTIDRGRTLRLAGIATMGAGGLLLLTGIIYGVKSEGYQNEISSACTTECNWETLKSRDDAGERANTLSWLGYLGGTVVLGAGVGLYVFGTTKVERVTVSPTTGGAAVSARIRF